MNIKISKRLLEKYNGIEGLFKRIDFYGEIDWHVHSYGVEPKRVTILHYLEDSDKYRPTKGHMVLTLD